MRIERVRIPSTWTEKAPSGVVIRHDAMAEFSLGIGPCGKEVVGIEINPDLPNAFAVLQHCSDGELKTFVYPYHTVTGRIEIIENNS